MQCAPGGSGGTVTRRGISVLMRRGNQSGSTMEQLSVSSAPSGTKAKVGWQSTAAYQIARKQYEATFFNLLSLRTGATGYQQLINRRGQVCVYGS